jgi:hypothetical protein
MENGLRGKDGDEAERDGEQGISDFVWFHSMFS